MESGVVHEDPGTATLEGVVEFARSQLWSGRLDDAISREQDVEPVVFYGVGFAWVVDLLVHWRATWLNVEDSNHIFEVVESATIYFNAVYQYWRPY